MTVSAAEHFTIVSQSGSSGEATWVNTSNLITSGTSEAIATGTPHANGGSKTLHLSVPNWISGIVDGCEFTSLKITFESKFQEGFRGGPFAETASLTGGSALYVADAFEGWYRDRELDGDAAFWGLTGTNREIFTDLKSGAIKFNYLSEGSFFGDTDNYIKTIRATLTYVLPDTKRASILVTLP